jgi:hypothetical protein
MGKILASSKDLEDPNEECEKCQEVISESLSGMKEDSSEAWKTRLELIARQGATEERQFAREMELARRLLNNLGSH